MADAVKRLYEGMFLVDSSVGAAEGNQAQDLVQTVLDRGRAEVVNIRIWDDRRLAYEIQGHKRGIYVLSYFRAEPSVIGAMERDVQLSESLLRCLILRADHVEKMSEEEAQAYMNADTPAMKEPAEDEEGDEPRRRPAGDGSRETQKAPATVTAAPAEPDDGGAEGDAPVNPGEDEAESEKP